jgi:large subunit ribosomal protein L9
MKVILIKDVDSLGKRDTVVEVKDGFARNYLLPKKLALRATEANIKGHQKSLERFAKHAEKIRKMNMGLAERINTLNLKTSIKMGVDGKSFGSITTASLVDLLKEEGLEIDKKHIVLDEPIKHPGIYDVTVRLPEKVSAVFKLVVLEEGEQS